MYSYVPNSWRAWHTLVFVSALLGTGCRGGLEFQRQTVVISFPKEKDKLPVLLVYEGVGVGTTPRNEERDLERAKKELAKLASGERFYGGHPLAWFELKPDTDSLTSEEQKRLRKKIWSHLTVGEASFFGSGRGKLLAVQEVMVRNPDLLLSALNEELSNAFEKDTGKLLAEGIRNDSVWDEESLRLVQKAARAGHSWLSLEPGRLSFTLPGTQAYFVRLKRLLLGVDRFQTSRKDKPDANAVHQYIDFLQTWARCVAENPWSIDIRPNHMTISLGVGDWRPIRVALGAVLADAETKWDRQLREYAKKTLQIPLRDNVTAESVISDFVGKNGIGPK